MRLLLPARAARAGRSALASFSHFGQMLLRHEKPAIFIYLAGAAAVVLLSLAALFTSAAFRDSAQINLADGASGVNVAPFDIAVVMPPNAPDAGKVRQADAPAGVGIPIDNPRNLVPGGQVSTGDIIVFNNSEHTSAAVTLRIIDVTDSSVISLVPALRFTATAQQGGTETVLFEDKPLAEAESTLGNLASRGSAPQNEGDNYAPGSDTSAQTIVLKIEFPDTAAEAALNGGTANLALRLDASSTR